MRCDRWLFAGWWIVLAGAATLVFVHWPKPLSAVISLDQPLAPSRLPTRSIPPAELLPLPALATNEPPTAPPEPMPDSADRVADARTRCGARLAMLFRAAGVNYPANEIYLRVFKTEGQIELWARSPSASAKFHLVQTYPVLCASGRLGPKRREGDGQVPEGFYTVDRFNPRSLFHVSLGLNYPNAADHNIPTEHDQPRNKIINQGNALSIGCLAMGDAAVTARPCVAIVGSRNA